MVVQGAVVRNDAGILRNWPASQSIDASIYAAPKNPFVFFLDWIYGMFQQKTCASATLVDDKFNINKLHIQRK